MNTSYVPLEHPYQIIEYQGVLGIQIGTLIVTVDKSEVSGNGYAIETHSHPVVSYVNNKMHTDMKYHRSLSLPRPYEGVVWDKVELHQLRTLVREGEQLSWADFMDYCRRLKIGEIEGKNMNVDASIMDNYGMLLDWGIDIGLPKCSLCNDNQILVEVDGLAKYGDKEYLLLEGDMGIAVKYDDKYLMFGQIFKQVEYYLSLMRYFNIALGCGVKFWTQDLFMQDFVNELNEKWHIYEKDNLLYSEEEENYGMYRAAEDLTVQKQDE